jgi:hypothetical protein
MDNPETQATLGIRYRRQNKNKTEQTKKMSTNPRVNPRSTSIRSRQRRPLKMCINVGCIYVL